MEAGLAALRAAGDVPKYQLALRVAGVYWLFAEEPERALEYSAEGLAVARGRPHLGDLAQALVDHANVLIELERLDEAEALLKEAAPLLPQLGASNLDADGILDDLAAARGDWARAAHLFVVNAHAAERAPGLKAMLLRHIAIALAHLGADEDALELAATANAICESIGEAPRDPLTTRYGSVLDDARERLGPERSAHAARRGAALPEADSTTRAAEMVQTARVSRAR